MKLIGGFLNTEQVDCDCKQSRYILPIAGGDEFFLIVEDEDRDINVNLSYTLVATYGRYKIYRFAATENTALRNNNRLNWGRPDVNIESFCSTVIGDFCSTVVEGFCTPIPFAFGHTCFRYADCYDSVLEWQERYEWYPLSGNYFAFKQRLPIRIYQPQPRIEGVKTYQKSSGTVLRTGKIRTYIEYTLETDFLPEIFHRQLVGVLTSGKNLKINGREVEFGGDYQINWERKQDCFARATCKIIEKTGLAIKC
jgi:hypothetical protein